MGFKFNTIVSTISGSLTNFRFYRELIQRPLREAFIYLAILVALPTLLYTGSQIYHLNHLMVQFTEALKGNLPPMRIENGIVIMDGEMFRFEKENEFSIPDWKMIIHLSTFRSDRETERLNKKRDQGEKLTQEEEERLTALKSTKRTVDEALHWIDELFPDPEFLITSGTVESRLEESPVEDSKTARLLRETSRFNNYIFLVDLTTDQPQLTPGVLSFALGKDSYTISTPLMPKTVKFPEDTSMVINDGVLDSWRKSFIWYAAPLLALMVFVISYVIVLIFTLGGSAVAGLTASFLKSPLPFRRVFSVGVYAITPALLFVFLYLILILLKINLSYSLVIFLLFYGVYLIGATKKCCSPA